MRVGQILVVGMVMLAAAAPARADEADQAEIQLLKSRLDKLERKMAEQAAAGGLGASRDGPLAPLHDPHLRVAASSLLR